VRAASVWTKMAGGARADWPSERGEGVENARSTAVNRPTIKIRIPRWGSRLEGGGREGRGRAPREWGTRARCARGRATSRRRKGGSEGAKDLFMDLASSPSRAFAAHSRRSRARECAYVAMYRRVSVTRARVHARRSSLREMLIGGGARSGRKPASRDFARFCPALPSTPGGPGDSRSRGRHVDIDA